MSEFEASDGTLKESCRLIPRSAFGVHPILRIRDLRQAVDNYRSFQSHVARTKTQCAVVLKADAHGIGANEIAPMLYEAGCRCFFVEECIEGISLRASLPFADAKIFVMAGLLEEEQAAFLSCQLIPCLNCMSQIERWSLCARGHGTILDAAIHLDSGMNRIGIGYEQACDLAARFDTLTAGLKVDLYMSHLATVKGDDHSMSFRQLEKLHLMLAELPRRAVSFSCTDGVILLPNDAFNFDIVRIGVGLLGGAPNSGDVLPGTEPMIEVYVKYSQTKWVEEGETIGYGGAFTARRRTRIALAHIGYKDGYLRTLSNTDSNASDAWMAIGGYAAPVIGKVSLGLTTLDITDVPQHVLDRFYYAEVLGPNVDVRKVADITGCYEVIASLGRKNLKVADYNLDSFERACKSAERGTDVS